MRSESHQVSIIRWCRDANASCASDVSVTQLVGELLQVISIEIVVVPQHVVVSRTRSSLLVISSLHKVYMSLQYFGFVWICVRVCLTENFEMCKTHDKSVASYKI